MAAPLKAVLAPAWRMLPAGLRARLRRRARHRRVRFLWLAKSRPYSEVWGFDRGLPVDRLYIEHFMRSHADDVRGHILEIQGPRYGAVFGGEKVTAVTIVDIDDTNPEATLIADLCVPGSLAGHGFDCEIITQTLQLLPHLSVALENLWSALVPGGVLLMTVPAVSRVAPEFADFWRFTPQGLEQLLRSSLPESASIEIAAFGNVGAAVAFLLGLSVQNVGDQRLLPNDPAFPVLSCARVVRRHTGTPHHPPR